MQCRAYATTRARHQQAGNRRVRRLASRGHPNARARSRADGEAHHRGCASRQHASQQLRPLPAGITATARMSVKGQVLVSEPGVRAGVDAGHFGPPGDELGAGVVVGYLAFD
jgi:hypothetical protein